MTGRHDESEAAWRPPVTGGTDTGTPDFGPDPELAEAHLAAEVVAHEQPATIQAELYAPPNPAADAALGTQPVTAQSGAQHAAQQSGDHHAGPQHARAQQDPAQSGAPQAIPQQAAPHQAAPQQAVPQQAVPQQAVAQQPQEPNPNETQIVRNPGHPNPAHQGQQAPARPVQAQQQVHPGQHQQHPQQPQHQPQQRQQVPAQPIQPQPIQPQPQPIQPQGTPFAPQQQFGAPQQHPFAPNPAVTGPHPVGQAGYYADPQQGYGQQQGHGGEELSSARLLKQSKRAPQSGWRKAVYVASGRLLNVGESPAEIRRRELIARVNQPLRGCYKIAMLSLKGGVGKTTTTTTLGSTFSSLRGDRVIAVDANPDRGTLSQKIPLETTATVRHLLRDAGRIRRYSDIRAYTSQGPSRLEVLASEQDPAVSEAFSEDDYRRTVSLLEHFYNIVLTDCGTGLMHSAMKGVLDVADSLVIVSSGSVDGARSASATLDWLDAHGYRTLVARSVAVINSVRPKSGSVDLDKLAQHFGARCRAVCRIPFDPHLEEGAEIELERLSPETRLALLEMAATVADDFASGPRPRMA
ncbi:MinD-like ATPase involved in chromosome partitioning or flagellar assembly [Actinokineospora terrae]|uniref:MinD-like ATPase involved in chromosome partitioning or flagellar assembly n=1 Tax=Actinokineospora terrae TaxID=155974 RepID=A0A1H9RQX9_9PSEU|nr:MinD/ParA family protein [Actinokineospora terrae]SER74553.1 MinD-like ATPase involved in chromosome partitioning or flagellar assembly [Actinokineospora terrae]